MHPITNIVAATDFSATAELATRRAALIAKQLGAQLHLVHIVSPLDLYLGPELSFNFQLHYEQAQQEAVKAQLDAVAAKLREQFSIPVQVVTRIGRAHIEIASYALSITAGLIVAAAKGENTLLKNLLGSTALRLLRVASCPVLIVKNKNAEVETYRQVIAAVNFSKGSARVPTLARTIAPDAHIEALLIFDTNQEAHMYKAGMDEALLQKYRDEALIGAEKRLGAILAEQKDSKNMTSQILAGYPPASICERAKVRQADLIVIGKHDRSNIEDWLLGSVSKGVAHAAECDVLLMH